MNKCIHRASENFKRQFSFISSLRYNDFLQALPKDKPCYALVDVEVTSKSGAGHSKLCYIFWCPENVNVKEKMLYSTSKDALKKACKGTQCEIQAHDMDDLALNDVQIKLNK